MAETRDVVRTGSAGARKEGGPAYLAVHRLEAWAQAAEHLVAQTFDFPEGVIFGDPGIDVDHGHKLPLEPASCLARAFLSNPEH
jgi:hypothetical protein